MNKIGILSGAGTIYSYSEYRTLVVHNSETGTTTGGEALPERIEATKINAQRMKRIDKQIKINDSLRIVLENINNKWLWILIAESWCGDGAQNIPIISKMAECSTNIELKIILRDENLNIMDAYLTNSSRAIPKLICLNSETGKEVGTWGPRPLAIQNLVKTYKIQNPDIPHDEFVRNLHLWYAKDKGESLQKDFEQLISEWSRH
ncbi:MAG: thioredoxin family protein [Bacteroidia bacterium]|nr:thioredoxin family protein [Bacteroidia bacterium]